MLKGKFYQLPLGIIIRQSIQNTIISYTGIALGFVSTILLYPNILSPEEYGLTRLLISLTLICAQFAHLGINNIIIRFFPYFSESKESKRKLLTISLAVPFLGFIVFTLLYVFFEDFILSYYEERSALFIEYYFYLIPLVFAVLFFEVLNSYARALKDSVTGSLLNEVIIRVVIILILIVHHFEWINFPQFMAGFVFTYSIQPAYMLIYLYRRNELALALPFKDIKRRFYKGMGVYGAYSLLGGLAMLLVGNIDIIMLSAMTDLGNTAVYAIAFYVASVISIPQRAIGKIANPLLAGFLKEKKYGQIESLYQRTSLNQIIGGALLYIGIWANIDNLLYLLPPEYQGIRWVVIVLGAAKLFGMGTGINGGIILNSRYYRFDLYTNILLVVLTIITNYVLIQLYGLIGAAIATAISIFIYNFIKFVFVWIKFSMQPFQWNSLAVLSTAAGSLLISFQIPYLGNFFTDIIIRSLFITIVYFGVILLFNLSEDVRNLIRKGFKRLRRK